MADGLGDRCKRFEAAESDRRAMPGLPVLARLDGRAFHTLTRGLGRPFDERFGACMLETARFLLEDLRATVAYTQSDEITLLWAPPRAGGDLPFDGRFQKLCSVAAGLASAVFYREMLARIPEKADSVPCFDARVWQVPSREAALEVFAWREEDATKNSLQMAARAYYPHADVHERGGPELHELLHARGVNWNDYPARFKRGVYVRRAETTREHTAESLARIPEAHRPPPGTSYTRREVRPLDLPPIRRVRNATAVLFDGAPPLTEP